MTDNFSDLDKPQQKNRLHIEFGMCLRPLLALIQQPTLPTPTDYQKVLALLRQEETLWCNHAGAFGTIDGIFFSSTADHLRSVFGSLTSFRYELVQPARANDLQGLRNEFEQVVAAIEAKFNYLVNMIPLDWHVTLSEAERPFTFYMQVLDAISGVRQRFHYFDRYLKPEFYELYLRNLDRDLEIRLVTIEGNNQHGVKSVLPTSNLFKKEFRNYKLIQVTKADIHDRNLRVDGQVFTLGTSAPDAGLQPTHFGLVANADQKLDLIMSRGLVIGES